MEGPRYLLVRLSALGDVLFALEAVAFLRRHAPPNARIDVLTEDRCAPLLRFVPGVERVLVYPRRRLQSALARPWRWPELVPAVLRHLRALRRVRYEAVLDLQGNLKSACQVAVVRARRKFGYGPPLAREGAWLATSVRLDGDRAPPHRADQGLALAALALGREPEVPAGPLLEVPPEARADARRLAGARDARPLVVLAPGTSAFAAFKRWPIQRFARLHELLRADGLHPVFSFGPGEEALETALRDRLGSEAVVFRGSEHRLELWLGLMAEAAAVVAADSGALHVAQALGTPAVALFGPKDPERYGPRHVRSVVLRAPVPCAPCGRRRCPAPLCVRGITPEAVRTALTRLLGRAGHAA